MPAALRFVLPLLCLCSFLLPTTAEAQVTAEHRRELLSIKSDLAKAGTMLRYKKVDIASELVTSAQERLNTVITETKLPANTPAFVQLQRVIELRKTAIGKLGGDAPGGDAPAAAGVSFTKEVAPILARRCGGCHGGNSPGGLNLGTFTNMMKGGRSGASVVATNPAQSTLYGRLVTTGPRRMPKDGNALPQAEINTIAKWINEGAKFDGNDANLPLNQLKVAAGGGNDPKPMPGDAPMVKSDVQILKPTGTETVSFKEDIAPFMVNICMQCHSGNNPRGGLSMETFEKLMIGGNSGRVVIPGNLDGSRLWDLAGKQDPIKMPPGNQLLITRTNWNNLRTWIQEGARFDGDDPKAPLRKLVPTEEEKRNAELAKWTKQEWQQHRLKRANEIWETVSPKEPGRYIETKEFFVYGDVSETRLEQVGKWAEEQAKSLRRTFDDKSEQLWKGKLAIFVVKDRFGFEEFSFVLPGRPRIPRDQYSLLDVDTNFEEAYVALEDVGDSADTKTPGMRAAVIDVITTAFFAKGGDDLPTWVRQGTGLALAGGVEKDNAYLEHLRDLVPSELLSVKDPEAIFADGQFSPMGTRAVGYTLAKFLIDKGGEARYGKFVASLQKGTDLKTAIKGVYRLDLKTLAYSYARGFRR